MFGSHLGTWLPGGFPGIDLEAVAELAETADDAEVGREDWK